MTSPRRGVGFFVERLIFSDRVEVDVGQKVTVIVRKIVK